jgi:hypothetical protein
MPDCKYPPAFNQIIAAWKCGNNKVYVAHQTGNGSFVTICISYNALAAHIANHGDYLGPANNASCSARQAEVITVDDHHSGFEMEVVPNPASQTASILLHGFELQENPAAVMIFDQLGRVVLSKNLENGDSEIYLDFAKQNFSSGTYTVVATAGGERLVQRLIILK